MDISTENETEPLVLNGQPTTQDDDAEKYDADLPSEVASSTSEYPHPPRSRPLSMVFRPGLTTPVPLPRSAAPIESSTSAQQPPERQEAVLGFLQTTPSVIYNAWSIRRPNYNPLKYITTSPPSAYPVIPRIFTPPPQPNHSHISYHLVHVYHCLTPRCHTIYPLVSNATSASNSSIISTPTCPKCHSPGTAWPDAQHTLSGQLMWGAPGTDEGKLRFRSLWRLGIKAAKAARVGRAHIATSHSHVRRIAETRRMQAGPPFDLDGPDFPSLARGVAEPAVEPSKRRSLRVYAEHEWCSGKRKSTTKGKKTGSRTEWLRFRWFDEVDAFNVAERERMGKKKVVMDDWRGVMGKVKEEPFGGDAAFYRDVRNGRVEDAEHGQRDGKDTPAAISNGSTRKLDRILGEQLAAHERKSQASHQKLRAMSEQSWRKIDEDFVTTNTGENCDSEVMDIRNRSGANVPGSEEWVATRDNIDSN